jgi:hypothetical protein
VSPRSTPEQLRHAKLHGRAAALRGAVWKADPDVVGRHRDELPEVWVKVDDLIALLGDPMRPALPLFRADGEDPAP